MSNDPELIVSPNRVCPDCDGDGWFTETVESSAGGDTEVDYPCHACEQTGVVEA